MKFTDIVKLKTIIVMFKPSTNKLTYIIQKLFISGRKHEFIRKKLELIKNRFVFQLLAQNYGIIIII